jgi:SAM-dependent methyltransferase
VALSGPRAPRDGGFDLDAGSREHYVDAALYDFEYRRRRADVNWYRELAQRLAPQGPVLELGVGSGRVACALARDGAHVVGVDLSQDMLDRAAARAAALPRAARPRVELVRGDMREIALGRRFPLVICPFNAFQHLYARSDVEAALARVRAHLQPGGKFAFDVLMPDLRWLTRDPDKRWARTKFTHPETGTRYEYTTNTSYDPVSQIAYMRIYYKPLDAPSGNRAREKVVHLAHRQFFPAELMALMHYAGYRVEERWGGFHGEPMGDYASSQIVVSTVAR